MPPSHYAAGMNACISVGKLAEARALIQDMKQQSILADIRVFNILLKGYSRRGGVAAVPGIMQEMADAGLKPSAVTYNTLIDTYVNAAQLPQARQTCSDALNAGQDVVSGSGRSHNASVILQQPAHHLRTIRKSLLSCADVWIV